jgi:hypothetical protein
VETNVKFLLPQLAALLLLLAPALPAWGQAREGVNPAALQRIEAKDSILVYVDYVTGLDNLMNTIPARQYRNNIEAFAKFNALFEIPAVILGEENEYYGTFLPEITKHVTYDARRYERTRVSGYTPAFKEWLKSTGRKNVIIGGISLDNCTLATSLDLLRDGYNVYFVVDVSGTNSPMAEEMAVARLRDAGGVPVTWLNVATEIAEDFNTPNGRKLMGLIQQHWPASTVGPTQDLTPDGHGMQLPPYEPTPATR